MRIVFRLEVDAYYTFRAASTSDDAPDSFTAYYY